MKVFAQVRDKNRRLVGELETFTGGKLVPRYCDVGTWQLNVPAPALPPGGELREALFDGGGLVFHDEDGAVIIGGPLDKRAGSRGEQSPGGVFELSGFSDDIVLGEEQARPSPLISITDAVSAQPGDPGPGADGTGYDTRTGKAGALILGYVNDNIGPGALAARRAPGLVVDPAGAALGATVTENARMDNLLELCQRLATAGGVGFRVRQDDTDLRFEVFEPADLSGVVQLTFDAGTLRGLTHSVSAPRGTHALVGGSGEGQYRAWVEVTTPESLQAWADWGRRVVISVERADTNDPVLLAQAGREALAGVTGLGSVKVEPVDTDQTRYPRDYGLGDIVRSYDLPSGVDVVDVVRAVEIDLVGRNVRARPVIGPQDAAETPEVYRRLRAAERELARGRVAR